MATSFVQRSFAGGEIAPALYARADQAKYQSGLAECENFIVMRHGGVYNRPGTEYIAVSNNNVSAANSGQRLWKFVYSNEHTYLLLFSHLSVTFYRNGFQLLTSGGAVHSVTTPYTAAQLAGLQFVQSGNELTIVHRAHPPKVLVRGILSGFTNFTLSDQVTTPTIASVTNVVSTNPAIAADLTSGNYVRYLVTAARTTTYEESIGGATSYANAKPTTGSSPNTVSWTAVASAAEYYIYKSSAKQEAFGYIGVSQGTSFKDNNITPDYSDTPPIAVDMFYAGNYPGCVGFFQQRQIYASTDESIEKVWMSRSGSIKNFTRSSPFKDDDGITFTIQGREVSEVRHVIEVGNLVILTSSGEWIAAGDGDGAIKPQSINLRQQGYVGSAEIQPIIIANNILYVQARKNSVRDFRYDLQVDGYTGRDLTVFSAHMFDGYQINSWTFQQIPHSVAWAVRNDGTLLGLTYVKEHEIAAWHRHTTDGLFEDVVCIPEGDVDAVYMLVLRQIGGVWKRFLERMHRRPANEFVNIKLNSVFLDCSLFYNGNNYTGAPYGATNTKTITITYNRTEFYSLAQNIVIEASAALFVSSDVGNAFEIFDSFFQKTIYFKVVQIIDSTHAITVPAFSKLLQPPPAGVTPAPPDRPDEFISTSDWNRAVDSISGLTHLAGKKVSALCDGNVVDNLTVAGDGTVQLPRASAFVRIGLPYVSRLKTLSIDIVGQETMSDKQKIINQVNMYVESSRGMWISTDDKNFFEWKQREFENWGDSVELKTGIAKIHTSTAWDKQGQVTVEQRDPLPLSILSIIPRVSTSSQT
jgi:hypothetical protein